MTDAPLPSTFSFHHLGYATRSLEVERDTFLRLGYRVEGEVFEDDLQGIRGVFLSGAGPRIELLENLSGSAMLDPWLASGTRIYHMGYSVPDLSSAIAWIVAEGAKIVAHPKPAIAFSGQRVAFVMLRNRFMLEFIEAT